MRRILLSLSMILMGALVLTVAAGDGPSPSGKRGPHLSGFYDFLKGRPEYTGGFGTFRALSCSIGQASQPSVYAGNMRLDCEAETPHNETTIAVDPGNPAHAIGGYHAYLLSFNGTTVIRRIVGTTSVTFDGGRNWREVVPPIKPYQFTGDPALAFDSRGRAYFANIADHEGPGGDFTAPAVVVARSEDGGLSWSPPVTVARGFGAVTGSHFLQPNIFNDKDYLAADTGDDSPYRDRVYVTWTRLEEVITPGRFHLSAAIALSSSDDGVTWSDIRFISGFSPMLCPASFGGPPGQCDLNQDSYPAVAPRGKVYVSFENFNWPALDQVLAVSSGDGGATWSTPTRVDFVQDLNLPPGPEGAMLTGCQFRVGVKGNTAADPGDPTGNTVYVVWADNRNGRVLVDASGTETFFTNTDVFLGRSADGGATWRVIPVDLSGNDQFFPWVGVAPDRRVDVGYMDRSYSAGQEECRYGFSLTRLTFDSAGDVTSRTKIRVDTGLSDPGHSFWFGQNAAFIGDYNGLAVDSTGATWSLWTDLRAPVSPAIPLHGQHAVGAVTH